MYIDPKFSPRIKRLITETVRRIPDEHRQEILDNRSFGAIIRDDDLEYFGRSWFGHNSDEPGKVYRTILLCPLRLEEESAKHIRAIIAHEFAHVYYNCPKQLTHEQLTYGDIHEVTDAEFQASEKEADDLAIEWGFSPTAIWSKKCGRFVNP